MKNILAVDTASKLMGVTLKSGDLIYSDFINDGFAHSENLLPMIKKLLDRAKLNQNDLDLLLCTRGPGSFTGLRIGMSTLKGMSLGLDIPLVSVPTLDLYAEDYKEESCVTLPIIDARKKCFYTAIYKNGIKESEDMDLPLYDILELLMDEKKIYLTGVDAELFYEKVQDDKRFILDDKSIRNYSLSLINLGLLQLKSCGKDSIHQGPVYIRKSEAEIMLNKKAK